VGRIRCCRYRPGCSMRGERTPSGAGIRLPALKGSRPKKRLDPRKAPAFLTQTMKAIQIASHGGPDVLKLANLPEPTPGADQALVRIKASAVNPLDGIVRAGYFPIAAKPPLILGEEAAGIVEREGAQFKKGERVIVYGGGLGVFGNGTWAELVAVPNSSLRRLPEGLSFEEGAALPNVGVTAYGALRQGGLKAGETLLVLGATGGVGSAGVQLGKALGARVIAVVSKPEKAAEIAGLGADHIVALSGALLAELCRRLRTAKARTWCLIPWAVRSRAKHSPQ
jgi:NADPH:quinone reductase-like Zn-dependent oxidoreductase